MSRSNEVDTSLLFVQQTVLQPLSYLRDKTKAEEPIGVSGMYYLALDEAGYLL